MVKLSRINITREVVFEAARDLIGKGRVPTQESIREYLGRGSRGTIHKYLKQWKQACFEQGIKDIRVSESEEDKNRLKEKKDLEQHLNKQIILNKTLSHDLLMAEREVTKFREQVGVQQKQLEILQQQYETLEADYKRVVTTYESVCLERDTAIEKIIIDKNHLIEKLREELKETHQQNLVQLRDWSYEKEDQLMQEKVKNMNYEEQLKTLKAELNQVTAELVSAKNAVEPLQREIMKQRQLAEDKLNSEAQNRRGFSNG